MMVMLDGYELYMEEPNRVDDLDEHLVRTMKRINNQYGKRYDDLLSLHPRTTRQYSWLLDGRQAIADFKNWLAIRKGKLVPFWVPSWRKDIRILSNIKGSVEVLVAGQHAAWYRANLARARIVIYKQDYSYIIRNIIAARLQYPNTILTLSSALDFNRNIVESDVRMVSFLQLCRLDTDAVEIHWHTMHLAEVKAVLIEIPVEVPALT